MQPKQPPWPKVSFGVSVRGRRYLGTCNWRSRSTIWNMNGRPATKPTIDTNQGAPLCAAMNASTSVRPLMRAAYSRSVLFGSWWRSRKRMRVSWVQGSLYSTGISMIRVCNARSATASASAPRTAASSTSGAMRSGSKRIWNEALARQMSSTPSSARRSTARVTAMPLKKAWSDMLSLTSANRCSSAPKL
ncbi:hypothetical protein D3C78_1067240 [compost metagenome]